MIHRIFIICMLLYILIYTNYINRKNIIFQQNDYRLLFFQTNDISKELDITDLGS